MMRQKAFWEGLSRETDSKDHYRLTGEFFQRVDIAREKGGAGQPIEGSIKIVPTVVFDSSCSRLDLISRCPSGSG